MPGTEDARRNKRESRGGRGRKLWAAEQESGWVYNRKGTRCVCVDFMPGTEDTRRNERETAEVEREAVGSG